MLTLEQCREGRPVERRVSGPNGATWITYRGFVLKALTSRVRVVWRYSTGSYPKSTPSPVLHTITPFTSVVNPSELT